MLKKAAGLLRRATSEFESSEKDYALSIELTRDAIYNLETARSLDPSLVPESLLQDLVATSRESSRDALALMVMTSDDSALEEKVTIAEREIKEGDAASGRGEYRDAIDRYQAAVKEANSLIRWNARGMEFKDKKTGFFGEPLRSLSYDYGFELGDAPQTHDQQPRQE